MNEFQSIAIALCKSFAQGNISNSVLTEKAVLRLHTCVSLNDSSVLSDKHWHYCVTVNN